MKEQFVSGLTPRCVSQDCSSGEAHQAASCESSVVFNMQDSTADNTAVPMSNLELLGDVAYAMSQPDGTDVFTDTAGFAVADGQMPGSHVIYVVPADEDGTPQSFASMLQPTVEPVEDGENMTDNDSARSITDITNTPCLYYGALTDTCEMPYTAGQRSIQYSMCNAIISTNERYKDNMAGSCMEDELDGCQSDAASLNIVTTNDTGFIHNVDTSLEPFSLSMLTDAVTS